MLVISVVGFIFKCLKKYNTMVVVVIMKEEMWHVDVVFVLIQFAYIENYMFIGIIIYLVVTHI